MEHNESLIMDNVNLVYFALKKLNLYHRLSDYYDVGMIGLIKAAKTFDNTKGYSFSTYALKIVINEILLCLRKEKSNKQKVNFNTIPLDTEVCENITLEDVLESDVNVEEEVIKKEMLDKLYISINKLNDRERDIIIYSYGLYNNKEMTQIELQNVFNISQAQISRLKNKAIKKLKELMEV